MFALELIVELASFKQLNTDVNRVIRLVHLEKFHDVFVVELPHELDLIDQGLLALVFSVSCLLGKCLDSKSFFIFQPNSQINGRKVTLSDLFDRFEELVEASLIELASQDVPPFLEDIDVIRVHRK